MPEDDTNFTPDVFDGTYLSMGLAITRDGDGSEFAKVKNRLREMERLTIDISHNNTIMVTII